MTTEPTPSYPIGTVVQLKSGGPRMTVEWVTDYGNVGCVWFVNGEIRQFWFSPQHLMLASVADVCKLPFSPWHKLDIQQPPPNSFVVWRSADPCQSSRLGFSHEPPEGFDYWMLVPPLPTPAQP